MNSGIQDAHNLAWKLAAAVRDPGAHADALLESYSEERTSLVGRFVQPMTDALERFQTARPHRRIVLTRALEAFVGMGRSSGTLTRRFSMLDVRYGPSRLLSGHGVGRRVPDALTDDGRRLYGAMPSGAILWAGEENAAKALASRLGLPAVHADLAALTRFFDREEYVALVRPDHIIGAVADPATLEHEQFAAALGR
jgi:hypothetical protein